ncbi:hypothetical protein EPVG_00375 [Emiliania huxleyi virus 201]|nr:hypothetical protein ELVG_00409 [Emiliania huxleyi virus 203]AEP15735.1 hypothetical protein EQVG_00326 [Emiliania huxleyi virus 207]AEP16259.1 hypothetical protein ERVG_00386 [Emiliania huxleyi virus 208]AET98262.1 hypothetical protein EPVG_00375 [Emiliania huxleyi virus 201]
MHPPMHPPFLPPTTSTGLNKTQITFISIGSVIATLVLISIIAGCKLAYMAFTRAAHPPVPSVSHAVAPAPEMPETSTAPVVTVEHLDV